MRITLTDDEIITLAHIMDHFTDYMAYDDRLDHGLAVLKHYRDLSTDKKMSIYILTGKLVRARRKIQHKIYENSSKSI